MSKWIAALLFGASLSCTPLMARACSYPDPPTFRSALKRATAVFVFRLDETDIASRRLEPLLIKCGLKAPSRPCRIFLGMHRDTGI